MAWHLDGWGCADAQLAGSLVAACLGRGGTDSATPFQSSLEAHDLASGMQVWQRGDIALSGHSRVSADRAGRLLASAQPVTTRSSMRKPAGTWPGSR